MKMTKLAVDAAVRDVRDKRIDQAPARDPFIDNLLSALGFDPATHDIWVANHPCKGIRVVDDKREPVAFFSEKQLKRFGTSEEFAREATADEHEAIAELENAEAEKAAKEGRHATEQEGQEDPGRDGA